MRATGYTPAHRLMVDQWIWGLWCARLMSQVRSEAQIAKRSWPNPNPPTCSALHLGPPGPYWSESSVRIQLFQDLKQIKRSDKKSKNQVINERAIRQGNTRPILWGTQSTPEWSQHRSLVPRPHHSSRAAWRPRTSRETLNLSDAGSAGCDK